MDAVSGKVMGLVTGDMSVLDQYPLHLFHTQLKTARHKMSRTSDGNPVVSPYIDQYLNAALVPDHARIGTSKNILEIFFKVLRDERRRETLETQICVNVSVIGLPKQTYIYNRAKGGLNSMLMSYIISVMLI